MLTCSKCYGKMFVDRVFTSEVHLETYCINCGKRDMYHYPENHGKYAQWIFNKEKARAKSLNIKL